MRKKLATLIASLIALSGSALAQGTIDFHNPNTFPLKVLDMRDLSVTTLGAPGSPLGPGSMRVGLFIGGSGATSFSQLTMVGLTTNSASTLPIFIGTFNVATLSRFLGTLKLSLFRSRSRRGRFQAAQ